jgi:hypothetical protein
MMKKLVAVSLAAVALIGGAVTADAKSWYEHGYDHDHGMVVHALWLFRIDWSGTRTFSNDLQAAPFSVSPHRAASKGVLRVSARHPQVE